MRTIGIVTACMRNDGKPTLVRTDHDVRPEEIENGAHYFLAEGDLLLAGYEEPFVHFAEDEAPDFLFPAVEKVSCVDSQSTPVLAEGA
jgi:hypothetical protein